MKKEYNIGLDIGTNSVGWAVVEENTQKIIKKTGKALWGVRLFDPAETAMTRRNFRSTRRRYDRRRTRIKLLQEEFKQSMDKIDPDFFKKLQESKYHKEDSQNKTVDISKEEQLLAVAYNNKYKTIYHLRKQLIENPEKIDLRLVYLALHHIIKYRGNFLYANNSFNVASLNVEDKLTELFQNLCNVTTLELPEDFSNLLNLSQLAEILLLPSKIDIKEELKNTLSGILPKPFIDEFTKLVNGNKFNFEKMICIEDADKKTELSFKGSDFDDKYDEYENNLGDNIELLGLFKELYDALFLKKTF